MAKRRAGSNDAANSRQDRVCCSAPKGRSSLSTGPKPGDRGAIFHPSPGWGGIVAEMSPRSGFSGGSPLRSPGSRPVLMEGRPAGTEKLHADSHLTCMGGTGVRIRVIRRIRWQGKYLGRSVVKSSPSDVGCIRHVADAAGRLPTNDANWANQTRKSDRGISGLTEAGYRTTRSARPGTRRLWNRVVHYLAGSHLQQPRPAPKRSGFTLTEMLIVMAVLAAMAAFALPALNGPLDKSRLRASAKEIQAALGKTRAVAIREGIPCAFRYSPQGNRWQIVRTASSPFAETSAAPQQTTASGLSGGGELLDGAAGLSGVAVSKVVRSGTLPDGISFVDPTRFAARRDGARPDEASDGGLPFDTEYSLNAWSQPVTFRPNGRTVDSELLIIGSRGFAITVSIRGLTSVVSYSAPFRQQQTDQLALSAVADGESGKTMQ
jgi:prepilin-type N-terminal cleavage/methylation domain-containing protein